MDAFLTIAICPKASLHVLSPVSGRSNGSLEAIPGKQRVVNSMGFLRTWDQALPRVFISLNIFIANKHSFCVANLFPLHDRNYRWCSSLNGPVGSQLGLQVRV